MIDLEHFPRSPTAQKMLGTVSPIYARSYVAKWLYEVMGSELDEARQFCEELRRQAWPETATWGLAYWEQRYHIPTDTHLSLEERRGQITAKRGHRSPLNPAALEHILEEYAGRPVEVTEHNEGYWFAAAVDLLFVTPDTVIPGLKALIRQIKPSHLSYELTARMETIPVTNQQAAVLAVLDMRTQVWNLADFQRLDGSRLLDGSWPLGPVTTKGTFLRELAMATAIHHRLDIVGQLCFQLRAPAFWETNSAGTRFTASLPEHKSMISFAVVSLALAGPRNRGELAGTITMDGTYLLDGSVLLDGSHDLNAELRKEDL